MLKNILALIGIAAIVSTVLLRSPKPIPSVPFDFIRASSPLAVSVIWEPEVFPIPDATAISAKGPTTYVFWNSSDQPLTVKFPPQQSFTVSERQLGPRGRVPEFMSEVFSMVLAPKEERRFDGGNDERSITGPSPLKFEEGPGPYGWVFDSDDQNPIGTVICKRFVVGAEVTAKEVEEQLKQERDILARLYNPSLGENTEAFTSKP